LGGGGRIAGEVVIRQAATHVARRRDLAAPAWARG